MRRRSLSRFAALLPLLAIFPLSKQAHAQGWIEPPPGRSDPGVVKVRTSVQVHVTDRVAQVEVEEWFRNSGRNPLGEGDYIYPLPGEAVFSNFSLFQGDQELRGETMDADRARSIYEEIVRKKRDPALIELVGHGLVRARVFPINPGETRKITLRYTQLLQRAGDAVQFRYAAGGRFGGIVPPGSEHAPGVQTLPASAPLTFMLTADNGELFRDAFSPTHELRVTREAGHMVVRPAGALEGDLALFLPLAERAIGLTLATHRPSGEDGYFMLTLSPGEAAESQVPRDITAVVDVSGSMSGEKIEQARSALRQLLQSLDRRDRFRLIRFSSGVTTWREDWTVATADQVREGLRWVDELRAEGGTNIAGALTEAFRASSPDSRLPVVVFVTDGLPSAGETNPERIAQQAEHEAGRTRVFAFGVGYDVNTYLLDRLGAAGRGSTQYVQPGEDVEAALGSLTTKIRHPVLADLDIAGSPVRFDEIYPRKLPDLFAGEDLVIFGRYHAERATGDVSGDLAIGGQRNGRSERYTVRATFPAHETGNDFIPRLWASRKIGALEQDIRLNGANPELVDEIRQTALRYGLLSAYTSYLVQEPELLRAQNAPGAGGLSARVAAAPPASQQGQQAVMDAVQSQRSREAKTLQDVKQAQESAQQQVQGYRKDEGNRRDLAAQTVAGRSFTRQSDGSWKDAGLQSGAKTVRIDPFSDAYFALLRALPELQPYWTAFDHVVVMGRNVAIELTAGGSTRLSDAELAGVVQQFRAR